MEFCAKLAILFTIALLPHLSAQQITARYYPEKQHYLVGEPIIVVYEFINASPKAVTHYESNCQLFSPNKFEVDDAPPPKRTVELYGCGPKIIAGSCLGSLREIRPNGKSQERFLLEGAFELNAPRKYHIRAKRSERVHAAKRNELIVELNVASEFDVTLRAPKAGELEAAYQAFFGELTSRNSMVQFLAASAIAQNPPFFAEAILLSVATDPSHFASAYAVRGLQRLATPSARATLLQMASPMSPKGLQQHAIEALGLIGNPEDCQAMLAIASASRNYTQAEAYTAAGRICKERALPALTALAGADDRQLLMGVAGGLANTYSRSAVPPLITLLQSPDSITRGHAEDGLAKLTHRRSKYGVEDEDAAEQSHIEWLNWWSVSGNTAPIYGSDQCMPPQPLY